MRRGIAIEVARLMYWTDLLVEEQLICAINAIGRAINASCSYDRYFRQGFCVNLESNFYLMLIVAWWIIVFFLVFLGHMSQS